MILEWNIPHQVDLYVHPRNSNYLRSQYIRPGKQIRLNLLRSISVLYKILPTNLEVCKPTFYTFYASHLRWNSSMRCCIYHTDLGQNAVFHCFSKQLYSVNIQDDQSLAFSETVQKISKITYTASRFSAFDKRSSVWMNINRVTLQHNNEFIMLIFLFNGFNL